MAETTQFTIGADASCTDGFCGEVRSLVVDADARTVAYLVVEPKHRQGVGRLVPLQLVDATTGEVQLRCTLADFENLEFAEATQFWPGSDYVAGGVPVVGNTAQPVTFDTVPSGEVAVHGDSTVHASDGEIGRIRALVVDTRDHHVTHLLLREGHLWGRKEVAIPISAVTRFDDAVRLNITKHEVKDLPPVTVDRPNG